MVSIVLACAMLAAAAWLLRAGFPAPAPSAPQAPLVERIDELLPQTQCGQCGFGGCRPYAQALAEGQARINRCPPGGTRGIERLAALLEQPVIALDPECGVEKPLHLAFIREDECIGCTKCIQACPVDAIVGAAKLMHTVVEDLCTGCELCIPPCPVDCIELHPAPALPSRHLLAPPVVANAGGVNGAASARPAHP